MKNGRNAHLRNNCPHRGERKKPLDYNEFLLPRKLKLAITTLQNTLSDDTARSGEHRTDTPFRDIQGIAEQRQALAAILEPHRWRGLRGKRCGAGFSM